MENVLTVNELYIRITEDEMEAYLTLPPRQGGGKYDLDEVFKAIKAAGVGYGLRQEVVEKMVTEEIYSHEMLIANGVQVVDGEDGYFEFKFNTELNNRPTVHADGSVDYWSIHAVEIVEEGQEIAIYHEPTPGSNGVTVRGKFLMAKKGRPQPPLIGRGFDRSEDGSSYTANMEGKIEMRDKHIQISPVYEVTGDVDMHTGNIVFRGDVIVHGNICAGFTIKATGSVTVDGTAESCGIEAGKDIILRGGMLGGNKGYLKSKGNIFARFIEYATVEAEGYIDATSALNCKIHCYDKIYMSGRHADIIGGNAYGAGGIEVTNLGNNHEVATVVAVGVTKELMAERARLENQISNVNEVIRKINDGIAQFDEAAKLKNLDLRNDERRVALLRTRIMKQAEVAKDKEELSRIKAIEEKGKNATVRAFGDIYPNVTVWVDTSFNKIRDTQREVEFIMRQGKVIMTALVDARSDASKRKPGR